MIFYIIAGVGLLVIFTTTILVAFTMGLFKRRPTETNYYLINWTEAVYEPQRRTPKGDGKRLVSNRPKMHARIAAREAEVLTDDNLADALDRWRGTYGDHV